MKITICVMFTVYSKCMVDEDMLQFTVLLFFKIKLNYAFNLNALNDVLFKLL